MRLEDITTMPPVHTPLRPDLIDTCLRAVTARELASCPTAAAGDAAAAETLVLKNFFTAIVNKLSTIQATQDATT